MSLTKREAAIVSAYTGYLIGGFDEMHKYAEEVMGRPIWTHQFADQKLCDALREAAKPDFLAIEVTE